MELEHLVSHPVTHEAHALRAEMELVTGTLATEGGDDVCIGHYLGQVGQHHFIESGTNTVLLGIFQFSCKQGNCIRVKPEVGAEVVVDLLHPAGPFRIIGVGLSLVHQHSLDDAVFLRFACGLHQPLVRVHPIKLGHVHKPAARRVGGFHGQILFTCVLVPELQFGAGDGDVDHTYLVLLRQDLDHLAAEEIDGTHIVGLPANGRDSRVPVVALALEARHIHGRHELETGVVEAFVLFGGTRSGLHVGLAET